jgi:hypothetical protein
MYSGMVSLVIVFFLVMSVTLMLLARQHYEFAWSIRDVGTVGYMP